MWHVTKAQGTGGEGAKKNPHQQIELLAEVEE